MEKPRIVVVPKNIKTKQDLFSFFAHELKFPSYFSANWDSFDEIINDLSWITESRIEVIHSDIPLKSSPKELGIYLDLLLDAFGSASTKIRHISFEK